MQKQPLATWNPASSAWETTDAHLCGHSVVYSETWPSSGMTRRGVAYALPTLALPTDGSESSSSPGLLPTPRAEERMQANSADSHVALSLFVTRLPR